MGRIYMEVNDIDKRCGKTLLINNVINKYTADGLINCYISNNGFTFLTFNDIECSTKAYNDLKNNNNNKVKYSFYKIFLRFKTEQLTNDYNFFTLREKIIKNINEKLNIDNINIKLYTKDKKIIGSGEIIVDTKDALDLLLKERTLKLDDIIDLNFYKFKINKLNKEIEQHKEKEQEQ